MQEYGREKTTKDLLKSRMRENRTYGSVRGGGSNADRLLDSDLSADADFKEGGYPDRTVLIALRKTKAINPSGNF